nr:MAG TPA: Mediator complex subunit 16 [Caudoviricetes sp.]
MSFKAGKTGQARKGGETEKSRGNPGRRCRRCGGN